MIQDIASLLNILTENVGQITGRTAFALVLRAGPRRGGPHPPRVWGLCDRFQRFWYLVFK